jgi:hypothetical protein
MEMISIACDHMHYYPCVAIKKQRNSLPNKSVLLGGDVRKLWFLVVFGLFLAPAFAQFSANVQGTVTDPKGAVVVGAKVTLTNTDTNVSQTFVSNSTGQYYFNRLAPGSYTVTVSAQGFEKTVQPIQLSTQETAGVDIQLKVGATQDVVTVSAEDSHGLNPEETRIQYTLSSEEIADFPLESRGTLGLLKTAPGATGIDEGHQNVAINRDNSPESVNGRGTAGNTFVLDSIPVVSELGGTSGVGNPPSTGYINLIPHPDMVQEIALQTTTFAVENGAGSGIQTSITTKSGTNKFHGDADYTYTGGPFRANSDGSVNHPPFRQQYIETALGGPIWKDRTFFFGSYFNQGNATPAGSFGTFYDPSFITWGEQNYPNSQNISHGLAPYPADNARPGTTQVLTTGGDLGGYNFITGSSIPCNSGGASAQPTQGMIPIPCDQPIWDQAAFNATFFNNGEQYNFRLDHSLREGRDRAYLSFFRFDQKSVSPAIQSTLSGVTPSTGYYLAGNYTHAFTSSLLNEASFGQTRFYFFFGPGQGAQSQLLLPYLSGCTCAGLNLIKFIELEREHQSYGRDAISWAKGKHNFTFGFQGAYNNESNDESAVYGRPFGDFSFFLYDYLSDAPDLELIYTLSAQAGPLGGKFIPQLFGAQATRFGAYVQDSWRVTPNLVLNYGIRWDDFGNPIAYGKNAEQFANVSLGGGGLLQQQVAGLYVSAVNNVYTSQRNNNFLPRAGFAYTLPFDKKTVVRGGGGLYSDDLNLSDVSISIPTQPPVRLSETLGYYSTPKALLSYGTTTTQGPPGGNPYGFQFPSISIYGYKPDGAPLDGSGNVVIGDLYGVDPNLNAQRTVLFNLGLERQLPKNIVVGATYTGSYSYGLLALTDVNTLSGKFQTTAQGGNQLLPGYNPDFGKIKFYRNAGMGDYNGLILTARQTVGKLTYQASYTWGKGLGDPISQWTDQYNVHSQYSYLAGDTRQRFTLTQVYTTPRFTSNSLLNEVVGGWNLSDTIIAQTGSPFTIADTTDDFNGDGTLFDLPAYTGSQRKISRSQAHAAFFNQPSSVFSSPANQFIVPPGTLTEGENGRQNNFFGPGYFTLDTALSKKIQFPWLLGERGTLSLRAEALNVLNHDNFNNPGGSFQVGGNNALIGQVSGTFQGRVLQVGGRFEF